MLSFMARPLRIEYFGAVYHVMARGDGGQFIFNDDSDALLFLISSGAFQAPFSEDSEVGDLRYVTYSLN